MYRLVVTDIDGTLLNNEKKITEATHKGIHEMIDRGVKFVVATGRVFTAGKWPYVDLGIDGPLITCNGALIKDTGTGEIIYSRALDLDLARKVSEICKAHDVYFHYYTEDGIHSERYDFIMKQYAELSKKLPESKQVPTEVLANYKDFLDRGETLYKIGIYCDDGEASDRLIQEIMALKGIACYKSLANSFDVMAEGVSKADAIAQLNKYYDIPREETIASGDNENDIDMIRYAGLGVAMGNAIESAKAAADYVTGTNEEDGLLQVIQKFIFDAE
ncbi:MAG: HAD family phosphatase [Clostridia bacterium]|nr:HAD family phosphatase [Clostridia bacterium]